MGGPFFTGPPGVGPPSLCFFFFLLELMKIVPPVLELANALRFFNGRSMVAAQVSGVYLAP